MASRSWCCAGVRPTAVGLLLAPAQEPPEPGAQRQQVLVVGITQTHRTTIASCHDEHRGCPQGRAHTGYGATVCDTGPRPRFVLRSGAAETLNAAAALGDFTTTPAILRLIPLAIVIGILATGIALARLDMIGFVTNLFLHHQHLSAWPVSRDGNTPGALAVVISVGGGLVVGLLAFFGSEQIRGHGIPEAMERILINGSRAQQRLALLKPVSSPVSSGTGDLFGAEGRSSSPGGLGSVVGQLFRLIAAERRALLVAGAAARLGGGARQRHERRQPRSRPHAVCGGGGCSITRSPGPPSASGPSLDWQAHWAA